MNPRTISLDTLFKPGKRILSNTFVGNTSLQVSAPQLASRSYARMTQKASKPAIAREPFGQTLLALVHEVRNPLTNINLSLDMLMADLKDGDLKIYLDIIRRNSIRINDLLTHLMKYQDALKIEAESHSIHQLLNDVLDIARDRIILKGILVRKEFAMEDFYMVFNKPEVKMAITNIVINAIEAMTGVEGELKLITSLEAGKFQLRIVDNGCGISKKNLRNIFKPFFTDRPGGLGLGLSTTRDALRSNRISVNVESEKGVGTTFILLFDQGNE